MARSIIGSVGSYQKGAKNNKTDIKTVQELLTTAATKLRKPQFHPGKVDSQISRIADRSNTVKAITKFQKEHVCLRQPDQVIDVGGRTWKSLVQAAGAVTAVRKPMVGGIATVLMKNKGKTRDLDITTTMKKKLAEAAGAVFGATAIVSVYSGGQPAKGTSTKRTGSVRHDNGHAADVTITVGGKRVELAGMEKLGQYWLAKKFGCAGVGMQSGRGIHLDEWASNTGPKIKGKMGRLWTYGSYSKSKVKLREGVKGTLPDLP